jgi:hypothetical protein
VAMHGLFLKKQLVAKNKKRTSLFSQIPQ